MIADITTKEQARWVLYHPDGEYPNGLFWMELALRHSEWALAVINLAAPVDIEQIRKDALQVVTDYPVMLDSMLREGELT